MDWDAAYSNSGAVPQAPDYLKRWESAAAAFRGTAANARLDVVYGDADRARYDLFLPDQPAKGLAIFIHGGYWRILSKDSFSHLASGALAHGWAVAIPSYTLCPAIRISGITQQIAEMIEHAADTVPGPVRIAGHSAGGHLASRMACTDVALSKEVSERISHVLSISGVHDLRPLMETGMNADFQLDDDEAEAESPALQIPRPGTHLTAWVGGDELPEFLRQNALIANIWTGLGAACQAVEDTRRHHFDVIEALADPRSPLTRCWLDD
ncbi:MAG: alpha/beta hydrolase [Pseudomonadota bacterium]